MLANQVTAKQTENVAETASLAADLVVFPIPSGFVPPQGVQPGESFEAIARVQFTNGKMVLEAIEGHEVRLDKVGAEPQEPISFENAVERKLDANARMA
jgi:hypothetical protein